jgi:hypothetical protein
VTWGFSLILMYGRRLGLVLDTTTDIESIVEWDWR